MGRPRGFDEAEVVRRAAGLFAGRSYDGVSIDELVTHLGVHRNSLYKTFGSKRGLYLAALRWSLEHEVTPLIERIREAGGPAEGLDGALGGADGGAALDLLLLAAAERAPADPEVATLVTGALAALDSAFAAPGPTEGGGPAGALTAALLGLRIRVRSGTAGAETTGSRAALARLLDRH
ncbi:TetR/AcrR family transcriptional regulator [Streptomyces yaizuensis]|uniref:TetR/AcrR family transcriptional regulator n=1 Tax=Streptomyces yaizuensis TaxID=2989713 RepID=A0ABQ5NRG8_9ACTN|nr:helix-turn-helix domain-containing protein [Streptomyces sp. YSPA8]GLF92940.1 TetR/AcrR family transcriptional regulator [Streptomyces sp. YSPA8]